MRTTAIRLHATIQPKARRSSRRGGASPTALWYGRARAVANLGGLDAPPRAPPRRHGSARRRGRGRRRDGARAPRPGRGTRAERARRPARPLRAREQAGRGARAPRVTAGAGGHGAARARERPARTRGRALVAALRRATDRASSPTALRRLIRARQAFN